MMGGCNSEPSVTGVLNVLHLPSSLTPYLMFHVCPLAQRGWKSHHRLSTLCSIFLVCSSVQLVWVSTGGNAFWVRKELGYYLPRLQGVLVGMIHPAFPHGWSVKSLGTVPVFRSSCDVAAFEENGIPIYWQLIIVLEVAGPFEETG